MKCKGINYDVGVYPLGDARPSRAVFDPAIVRREIEIIKSDLQCNAIRIVGRDLERLVIAAEFALDQGLEVWFGPGFHDADEQHTLAYFTECAKAAETLRQKSPQIVFIAGWELTFFMKGLVLGDTGMERIGAFMKPWWLLWSTLRLGPFNRNLNRFLAKAVQECAAFPWTGDLCVRHMGKCRLDAVRFREHRLLSRCDEQEGVSSKPAKVFRARKARRDNGIRLLHV